jgi:hypothetical protein
LYAIIETMSCVSEPRYEVLPFRRSEEQAAAIAAPIRLTVTTSPGEGVDRSLEHAVRLRALGHRVTLHLAARMVRGPSHLERPLARAADAGIDDLFVVGGDTLEPLGPYASAGALREPRRGIVGCHFFTFNEPLPTWVWQQELSRRVHAPSAACREA